MRINLLRQLIIPWVLFFIAATAARVSLTLKFHLPIDAYPYFNWGLVLLISLCLLANIRTLSKVGIWIADSLPNTLRYNQFGWIFRAVKVALLALLIFLLGRFNWMPLFWPGFVIPLIFSVSLFVGIWNLLGPLLIWTSGFPFNRLVAFTLSLPIFALVPLTALTLSEGIVKSYLSSQPEFIISSSTKKITAKIAQESSDTNSNMDNKLPSADKKAQAFRSMFESGKPCPEVKKEIQLALDPKGKEEVVYWAIKAVKCSDLVSVVALPRLARVMINHASPRVRAAAIIAMPKFGSENLKRISYLLVKRINDRESPEVISAAATVLVKIDETEQKHATSRLKILLDHPQLSFAAAQVLTQQLKHEDLVFAYISEHLRDSQTEAQIQARTRSVAMICELSKANKDLLESQIEQIIAAVKTGTSEDPAIQALGCLGSLGFQAIRQEMQQEKNLERHIATQAFASMISKEANRETLGTAEKCSRDPDPQIRNLCSQSLGKIGMSALPIIFGLLKSSNSEYKEAGKNALKFFNDPTAKKELEKVRAENTGWLANKQRLQVAEAISEALLKIENESAASRDQSYNQGKDQSKDQE